MPRRSKKALLHLPKPRDANSRRYFAYARVSSQDQADRDLSIPAQQQAIREYAARKDLLIIREYVDVESAKAPGRKSFTELIEALRTDGRIAGVICHKVDRLVRNFKDYSLIDDFMQAGVDFQFVTGNYDRSPSGMLGLGVQVLFAKHYLDNLSQEVKKGLDQRMLVERKWSFVAPLGYLNKDREIITDPERFALLREAWHRYASGTYSLHELADWLYAKGLRTRGSRRDPAGLKVRFGPLYAMLTNPFYYGVMRYKNQLVPGTHEPMIPKSVFDRVQELLHQRGHVRPKLPKPFTYRGFLVCGGCGCTVTAEAREKFYQTTNRRALYVYYHCSRSRGACRQPAVREEELEVQFARQLRALEIPAGVAGLVRKALLDSHRREKEFRDAAIAALRHRQDEIQKRQDVLLDRLLDGTVPRAVYDEKYTALQNEKAVVLVELDGHERANDAYFREVEEVFFAFASRLSNIFAKGDAHQKATLLKVVASNSSLKAGKARLNLKTAFAPLSKGRRVSSWLRGQESNLQPSG